MTQGLRTIVYPTKDLARAKALFGELLGTAPYVDEPYYVGFRVGDQEVGLDPRGHTEGATPYWDVDDIRIMLQRLLDAGAERVQDVRDVGAGRLVASVRDANGNLIGLIQSP